MLPLLLLLPFALAQPDPNADCYTSATFPTLQHSYTFAPDDTSPFCVDVTYSGCDYRYTDELDFILDSPLGTVRCDYLNFGPSTPTSGTITQCCSVVPHNEMNSDGYRFIAGSAISFTFSAFAPATSPVAPTCKTALEKSSFTFSATQTASQSQGYERLAKGDNTACNNVMVTQVSLYYNDLQIATCFDTDLTGSGGFIVLQCTSTRNDPRPPGAYPLTARLTLKGTRDGSTSSAKVPGTIKVSGTRDQCAGSIKLPNADVKKSEVAAQSYRIPVTISSAYCNNYFPAVELYTPNYGKQIADCAIASTPGTDINPVTTYATCRPVPGATPLTSGKYASKASVSGSKYNLNSVTYKVV